MATKAEKLAAAAGVTPELEGVAPVEGAAPTGVEGTKVSDVTAKGNVPVEGEPVSEAAEAPIVQQREHEQLEPGTLPEVPAPGTGKTVDAGGRVLARVVKGRFTVFDGSRLFSAYAGDNIKTSRAEVDRGVALGFLVED